MMQRMTLQTQKKHKTEKTDSETILAQCVSQEAMARVASEHSDAPVAMDAFHSRSFVVTPNSNSNLHPTEGRPATSGHRWTRKARAASALISAMSSGSVLLFGKDICVLELAADVNLMGAFGTILAVWGPFANPLSGYCMERNILRYLFPWERWGRRAPWYLTHLIGAAICASLLWLPPSIDPKPLSVWFLLLGSVLCWTLAVIFASFQSARVEIYPLKEERGEVEAYTKIMAGIGSGLGTLPQLIIAAFATRLVMSASSAFLFLVGMVSLFSVPVFCEARVPHDPDQIGSFFREFWSLTSNSTMRHLLAYRFTEGLYTTVILTSSLNYLTFVDGLW